MDHPKFIVSNKKEEYSSAWRVKLEYIYEPQHEISNNVVCAPSKGSD